LDLGYREASLAQDLGIVLANPGRLARELGALPPIPELQGQSR